LKASGGRYLPLIIGGNTTSIIDDLIATGGTLEAVAKMVERQGGTVAGMFGIIGLPVTLGR